MNQLLVLSSRCLQKKKERKKENMQKQNKTNKQRGNDSMDRNKHF